MLILCWNVAGLSTTVHKINDLYGKGRKGKPSVVLSEYFGRHGADIVCVQEHKIPRSQLSSRSEPLGCSSIDNYESFWSCCTDTKKKGLNGVVTYVKNGVGVKSANSRPLGRADLDDQGRCVMTDHGKFVLFNVYVPASSGQPLSYKMKFLNALRREMQRQRNVGKEVILVGDLNISHAKLDKFWSDRVLFINDILRESAAGEPADFPKWKRQIACAWPKIQRALQTRTVVPTKTTNSQNNKTYDKYRMKVDVDGRTVYLGSHESDPRYCEYRYNLDSMSYVCEETDEVIPAEEENVVCVSTISELMGKLAGITWDEATQRQVGECSGASRMAPPRIWLNRVIQEDSMVDAMRQLYPSAAGRYTCWNQNTNRRYCNEGARIDYTLVDKSLFKYVKRGNAESLRVHPTGPDDPNSEEAAACVATANGGFQAVSFQGGGIVEASQDVLDTQFGEPHTGLVYTPPTFSDHIAISLLLDDECLAPSVVLDKSDPLTRTSQPHKSQKTIASFFASASSTSIKEKISSSGSRFRVGEPAKKESGIKRFFVQPSSSNSKKGKR
ncbi:unnamed protein product [Cylindrotheca closterium]|uniref:Endonuclease/exonuclease/phosphatase domain-containing protein n=1 Tax=Cylindrotheca closterium TaxID=2856 RepID=A0AAD2G354_9STRA|nr:unnamed protein product [Cylindrotheca closterium]